MDGLRRAFFKVDEAARILGISRSAAYELANVWLTTGGQAGIPAIRLGRTIRIPRAAIERLLQDGCREGAIADGHDIRTRLTGQGDNRGEVGDLHQRASRQRRVQIGQGGDQGAGRAVHRRVGDPNQR